MLKSNSIPPTPRASFRKSASIFFISGLILFGAQHLSAQNVFQSRAKESDIPAFLQLQPEPRKSIPEIQKELVYPLFSRKLALLLKESGVQEPPAPLPYGKTSGLTIHIPQSSGLPASDDRFKDIQEAYVRSVQEQLTTPAGCALVVRSLEDKLQDLYSSFGLDSPLVLDESQKSQILARVSNILCLCLRMEVNDYMDFTRRFNPQPYGDYLTGQVVGESLLRSNSVMYGSIRMADGSVQDGFVIFLNFNDLLVLPTQDVEHEVLHVASGILQSHVVPAGSRTSANCAFTEGMASLVNNDPFYPEWAGDLARALNQLGPAERKIMLDRLVRTWLSVPLDNSDAGECLRFTAAATGLRIE